MAPPKTWDARQIKYMKIVADAGSGGTLAAKRQATAALPKPKLQPGVNMRTIRIERVPLKGLEDSVEGEIEAVVFDPPGTHSGFDLTTLVYFHGGGYTNMSPTTHQGLTSGFAAHGVRVVSIDYRLAPEDPFPAQLTDAISAYKHLILNDGVSEEKIFFGGDSAGGGLALSAAIWIRDHGGDEDLPMPAGLVLISPYVDVTHSSPTSVLPGEFEYDTLPVMEQGVPELVPKNKTELRTHPLLSPLADGKEGLPPQFWAMATADRLVGENLAMVVKRVEGAGESAVVDIYEEQVHVFQFYNFIKQTGVFFQRASEWMKHLSENPSAPPDPSVFFVKYSGEVEKVPEGTEDLKKRLAAYIKRNNGGKKRGGTAALEEEYFKVAGAAGGKAKL